MFSKTLQRLETVKFMFDNRRDFKDFIQAKEQDKNSIWRTPGNWYAQDIERYTHLVSNVKGDFAEIGTFEGRTFSKLIPIAEQQGKKIHAFDSFIGMDNPGELDWREKGQFDVGGPEGFQKLMSAKGFEPERYFIWDGYIPECLDKAPKDIEFSFVLVDVDNYEPTRQSLKWAWPRINQGGIIALDDFYPDSDLEASKAIKEFMRESDDFDIVDFLNFQLVLKKLA